MHGDAPGLQAFGNDIGCSNFFVRQFRVRVDIPAQRRHFIFPGNEWFN